MDKPINAILWSILYLPTVSSLLQKTVPFILMYHPSMMSNTSYLQVMCAVESVTAVKSVFISLMQDTKWKEIDLVSWAFS